MLPLATTKLRFERLVDDETTDLYEAPDPNAEADVIAKDVPAHVNQPHGVENLDRGIQVDLISNFSCDIPRRMPKEGDIAIDQTTGHKWRVAWCEVKRGLGLDRVVGQLRRTRGQAL